MAKLILEHPHSGIIKQAPVGYSDVRLYPVHRFEQVAMSDQKVTVPEGFSIDDYLASGAMDFGGGEEIKFCAKLGESLANYLAETPISANQKLSYQNDAWQVEATVRDSWQFQFWILSQGAEIEVLAPKALRDRIGESLNLAVAKYLDDMRITESVDDLKSSKATHLSI